jgi:hypothetical protein
MPRDSLEAARDELYGAPFSAFTAERKRLAKEHKELADLPKPSLSAWAVNRLWREEHEDFEALLDAGRRIRKGQMEALAEQKKALARLRAKTERVLKGDGHAATDAMLRRVTTTLQALSAEGTFDGRLVEDRDPPGFEALEGATIPARTKRKEPEVDAKAEEERARRAEAERQRRVALAEKAVASREAEVDRLREKLHEAERALSEARAELRSLR